MKKSFLTFLALLFVGSVTAAMPTVEATALSFNEDSGILRVDYTLTDGPAIITCDVLTNGVSVGGRHLSTMAGDVNRPVSSASGVIYWKVRGENGSVEVDAGGLSVRLTAHRKGFPPDYMVVDLKNRNVRYYYTSEEELPFGLDHHRYRTNFMVFRRIPASGASFVMGTPVGKASERTALSNEVAHVVSFTNDYYLSVFELTHGQYKAIKDLPTRPAGYEVDYSHPYMYGSYEGDMRGWRSSSFRWPQNGHSVSSSGFLYALRDRTGLMIDFPTEAQWEFAARAGSVAALPCGLVQDIVGGVCTNTGKFAWYKGNADGLQRVGTREPNAFGLYDMLGNVREMCLDVWSADNTCFGEIEPTGPETEARERFVVRGGSCKSSADKCRNGFREGVLFASSNQADIGFRLWCRVPNE